MRIAVVGSGIAGLTSAWLLSRRHDVIVIERDDRLGGHTHTHRIDTPDGPLALDTGFLVHNDRTYPLLVRLFDEIGVARDDSDMSFAVTDPATAFEYSTRDLNGLFADRRNIVRPGHYALLAGMLRFNRASRRLIAEADASRADDGLTLGTFLEANGVRGEVVDRFLLPLAAAIWSAAPGTIRDFPALTLVRFFDQHGMNTAFDHPVWKVVRGGSATYIPKLIASPRVTVWRGAAVEAVRRRADGVDVTIAGRPTLSVDEVVLACHGDEALALLADASPDERAVLGGFRTSTNEAILHTDGSWLPRRPHARAAWNYRIEPSSGRATVTYHLNRLQRLHAGREYCVTLNPSVTVEPYHILERMTYAHPLYTREAIHSQGRWRDVSGRGHTHFAGAYWFYGFHEDGVKSAVRVAADLGVAW